MKIKNVVVIGSGTMGSGIAAHLCNANIPVTPPNIERTKTTRVLKMVRNDIALATC